MIAATVPDNFVTLLLQTMKKLGAKSVLVLNNEPGGATIGMAGDDGDSEPLQKVTSAMVSYEDGQRLRTAMEQASKDDVVTVEFKVICP